MAVTLSTQGPAVGRHPGPTVLPTTMCGGHPFAPACSAASGTRLQASGVRKRALTRVCHCLPCFGERARCSSGGDPWLATGSRVARVRRGRDGQRNCSYRHRCLCPPRRLSHGGGTTRVYTAGARSVEKSARHQDGGLAGIAPCLPDCRAGAARRAGAPALAKARSAAAPTSLQPTPVACTRRSHECTAQILRG